MRAVEGLCEYFCELLVSEEVDLKPVRFAQAFMLVGN